MLRLVFFRLTHRLFRLVEAAIEFKRILHTGFWLGVLRRDHLHRIDGEIFTANPSYTTAEGNLRGLFEWEERAIDDFMAATTRVLVLGAGAGREVFALLDRGLEVDGFECNADLVDIGNRLLAERGRSTRLRSCERDRCPLLEGHYDAVIVGWSAYTLIQGRRRRVRLLTDLRSRLRPGGRVLVSFFFRHTAERRLRLAARIAAPLRRLRGDEPIEFGDYLIPNYVHFFNEAEVRSEFEEAGYSMLCYRTSGYGHAVGETRPER